MNKTSRLIDLFLKNKHTIKEKRAIIEVLASKRIIIASENNSIK
mgnify:CR=1 FL=1